ncbi:MAG: sodium-dependent transporter, partial [Pseudomonadota bacterium]|nr:sodium-dependent transporter [Pseudomonadota bacterium]
FSGAGEAEATGILAGLVSDPSQYRVFMGWHAFFLLLVLQVSAQGVVKGLERASRVVVPGTLMLVFVLFALASWHGRLDGAINHILAMHLEDLSWESLQAALFHAFFTLGLGMGVWAILGSYTTPHTRLKRSILAVVLMDTLVAILAGLMIYAIATEGNSFDGERGFSLLFVSMPVTLAQLPASQFVITVVFLMVVLIVWTTSLYLLEPIVGWFREWTGAPRSMSVLLIGLAVWLVGLASLLSFNAWAEERVGGTTLFRWLELVTDGLLIPLVAILIALFTGWCLTRHLSGTILGASPRLFADIWFWVMRLVLPLVVAWIGVQYTAFSLANLCSNGNAAAWCGQPAALLSEDGEALSKDRPVAATAAESDEEAVEAEKTAPAAEQKPPAKEGYDGKSGEKKTKTGRYPLP